MQFECKGKPFNKFLDTMKLVSKVYKSFYIVNNYIFPKEFISEDSLFTKSYFYTNDNLFKVEILDNTLIYDVEKLIQFLKGKSDSNEEKEKRKYKYIFESSENNLVCVRDDGEKYIAGEFLSTVDEDLIAKDSAFDTIHTMYSNGKYHKVSGDSMIQNLVNYEDITLVLNKEKNLAVKFTHKIFPNIKKVNSFEIIYFDDNDSDIFPIVVKSSVNDLLDEPLNFVTLLNCSKF